MSTPATSAVDARSSPVPTGGGRAIHRLRRQLDRRLAALETERTSWFNHWLELQKYITPRRGRFLVTAGQGDKGRKLNAAILDPTGTRAARVLASGMMTGITSPARPWFRLTISDRTLAEATPVKMWLDEVVKRIGRVIAKSNIYQVLPTLYGELGVFGTAAMLLMEDYEDVVRAYPLTVGEYYLACSRRQTVDTIYRVFPMTVAQLCEEFGHDNCSPGVRDLYRQGSYDTERDVVHVIEPNHLRVPDSALAKHKAWRSVWYEKGSDQNTVLRQSGFDEFPGMCPRWEVNGNDAYGRGPGMEALPDVRTAQVLAKRKQQMIDKGVQPPMVAPPKMKNEPMSLLPGGTSFVAETTDAKFRAAYEINPQWLGPLNETIADTRRAIEQAFFADLFLMISSMEGVQPRQNMEILERKEEKMLMLGPVLENLHSELLDPLINGVFTIMQRHGLIPPAPKELQGQDVEIEYLSILAQAQKSVATAGVERLAAFVGNLSAVKPEVVDKVDFDQSVDEYADMLGVSPKIVVDDEKVAELRGARAKVAQAQAAMAMAGQAAAGAKVLSETELGGGVNALALMTGGG